MRILFLVALEQMKLEGNFGKGLRLVGDAFLTNDPAIIAPLISPFFERSAGLLETDALRRAPAVVYAQGEEVTDSSAEAGKRLLGRRLKAVQNFLTILWLVKDNSINFDLGFLHRTSLPTVRESVSSNSRSVLFTNAAGQFSETRWSPDEVRQARDFQLDLFGDALPPPEPGYAGRVIPGDFNRMERALYFLQAARDASDLGNKVAAYVTCFEALFCTDSAEIAHKLGERVACFCGDSPDRRFAIFREMKDAYTIRSKTIHGDSLPPRLSERAQQLTLSLDSLLRQTLRTALTTPEIGDRFRGPAGVLEEHLVRLTLGAAPLGPLDSSGEPAPPSPSET